MSRFLYIFLVSCSLTLVPFWPKELIAHEADPIEASSLIHAHSHAEADHEPPDKHSHRHSHGPGQPEHGHPHDHSHVPSTNLPTFFAALISKQVIGEPESYFYQFPLTLTKLPTDVFLTAVFRPPILI